MPPYVTRGSWYSQLPPFGWFDKGDRPGSNALGVPDWQQGIALPSRRTLGQWYNVTPPGQTIPYPMQQTDTGPAPWTGRGVDISAAAAHQMGYTPKTFPTDAQFKVEPRDEPRGLGSPAGLPVQAGDLPDNATEGTAYASGPPARKSMADTSLMDMFQPRSSVDNSPIGIGDALAQNRNSLIGLGLGMLQPRSLAVGAPVGNAWTGALQGYQQGAQTDAANAYRQAQLAHQKTAEAFQRAQALRSQSNIDRAFSEQQRQFNLGAEGGKIPPGFAKGPDGNLVAIPGGPADPKYVAQVAEGKQKPRELSVTDIGKLSEEGGKFASLGTFGNTFEPRFAGYKASTVGELANLAGRNLPEGVVGKDVAEGATWWQGYDNYKNVVRHGLYGGALTPAEIAVFEKANVNPGMDPKQIQKNLDTQKEVVQNGLRRKANAMISAGYDPKTIAQAYGVDLGDIGVTATGKRGTVTPTAPALSPASGGGALDEARQAIKNGAPRDAVIKRLRENNIDPSGL